MIGCKRCNGAEASISETTREIVHLLRIAEKRPGTMAAKNSLARIPKLKERNRVTKEIMAAHAARNHQEQPA